MSGSRAIAAVEDLVPAGAYLRGAQSRGPEDVCTEQIGRLWPEHHPITGSPTGKHATLWHQCNLDAGHDGAHEAINGFGDQLARWEYEWTT